MREVEFCQDDSLPGWMVHLYCERPDHKRKGRTQVDVFVRARHGGDWMVLPRRKPVNGSTWGLQHVSPDNRPLLNATTGDKFTRRFRVECVQCGLGFVARPQALSEILDGLFGKNAPNGAMQVPLALVAARLSSK